MINTLSSSDNAFLRAVEKIQQRAERSQKELASGKRIFAASDEPDGVSPLLTTRAELESTEQIANNLSRTKAEVDAAEKGLQQAIKILDRARTLAAQGLNSFNADSTWDALLLEVSDLTQQMLNVSNLAIEGRFVYSGNSDTVQPFDFDPTLKDVTSYAGGPATRQSLFPGGSPFNVARPGDAIFDNSGVDENGLSKSVFGALRSLRDALESREPQALRSAIESVEAATRNVSNELSFYGSAQRRITEATAAADTMSLSIKSQLSRLEDADLTESILETQQSRFQLEAAFQVRSQRQNRTLFDYIG
ncbi:MAG: flagellin [Acidobacteriota bacterium]